jgi:hypothetical protein
MADAVESYGVSTLGTIESKEFVMSMGTRQIDITVKKVSTGEVIPKGTLMSKDTDGTYIKHNGTKDIAGVLNEDVDTTGGDVKTYLLFDCDVDLAKVFSQTAISAGFNSSSLINIMEAK